MAAQQVDAQAALVSAAHSLGESAAGGGNSVHQSQSVRHKSSVPKKTPVTKKVRPKRKAAKRFRRDRSRSEESRVISETNNSLSSERALRIPCRAPGCQHMANGSHWSTIHFHFIIKENIYHILFVLYIFS